MADATEVEKSLEQLKELLNQASRGKSPGFIVLVDRPGATDSLYTFNISLPNAARLSSSALNTFMQMMVATEAEIPDGTTIH